MANTLNLGNGNWAVKTDSLLGYNSENNNFKPLPFDFTRASSATVVNKDGLIETVGSGEPRIDFLGNTNGALLLEPQRTNKITYSEDFSNAAWGKSGASVVSGFTSPSGDTSAFKLVEDTSNSSHSLQSPFVGGASGADTFSIFAKSDGRFNFSIVEDAYTGINVIVNLQDGTITTTGQQANIISLKNGWYRIDVTRADNSSPSRWLISLLDSSNNASYQGDGTSGVYIYGAQLEQGSYATSYIPTSGSAVTRVADACTNGGNDQVINSTEGVLYAEISALSSTSLSSKYISISDGTYNNRASILFSTGSTNQIRTFLRVGGGVQIDVNNSVNDVTDFNKIAFSYKENDFKVYINGSLVSSDTSGSVWSANTITKLSFSEINTSVNKFEGNVKDVRVYNTALTDSELAILTTI